MQNKKAAHPKTIVALEGLQVPTFIGVYAHEKKKKQILQIDLCFSIDIHRAVKQDCLADTIDYTEIHSSILNFSENAHFNLLETFSNNLSEYLINQFRLTDLQLSVTKRPRDLSHLSGVKITIGRKPS